MANEYKDVFARKEVKYLLNDEQYHSLREWLQGFAEVDEYGKTTIYNIYFDTPGFDLIRRSIEKPQYKEKLRLRTYGKADAETTAFIEIKKKYDGIVYKRRIAMPYSEAIDYLCHGKSPGEESQISGEIDYMMSCYGKLVPAMGIAYDRIAMAGVDDPSLRITFDSNLRWCRNDAKNSTETGGRSHQILKPGEHLMEIKIGDAMDMRLARELSVLGIYPTSVSKYGLGYQQYVAMKSRSMVQRLAFPDVGRNWEADGRLKLA